MKKIMSLLLVSVMLLSMLFTFSACKEDVNNTPEPNNIEQTQTSTDDEPKNNEKAPDEKDPEPEPEPEPEPTKLTFDDFLKKAEGVWVYVDSIYPFGEEYSYSFCTLSKTNYSGGAYPGGGDRPAKIDGFEQVGENVFELNLLYEAGFFMDEEYPESRNKLVVTLLSDGTAKFKIDDGMESLCLFGGPDLPDAQKAIAVYKAK